MRLAVAGGTDEKTEDEKCADGLEASDDRNGDEDQQGSVRSLGLHAPQRRLLRIETQREQRAVEGQSDAHHDHGEDRLPDQVGCRHTESVAEQDAGQRPGVGVQARNDDDTQRQHPDEEKADRRVLTQDGLSID